MSLNYLKHQETKHKWENEKKAQHKNQQPQSRLNSTLHNKMMLEEVEKAIQSLLERRRQIFILSRHQDMTYKEIADFLDISENTVDTQIFSNQGALAALHPLADKDEAEILATIASTKYEGVAAVMDVLNTYFNRPGIPVGVPKVRR